MPRLLLCNAIAEKLEKLEKFPFSFSFLFLLLFACKGRQQPAAGEAEAQPVAVEFCADSAMAYCAAQCAFGPRTMNSAAHDSCGEWIAGKFRQYGLEVIMQRADLRGWDGTQLRAVNIIARLNPAATQRILLCAHWDSRPWADNDPDEANHHTPVMAANDGASGVAVMIELARLLASPALRNAIAEDCGIDFVCFDAEDYGTPSWSGKEDEASWALGAQHFARNLPTPQPAHGILLDMVGGQGAKFYQERFSKDYAQSIIDDVWRAAHDAGYGSHFPYQPGGYITDDHKPLIDAGIPTIDILPYYPDCEASAFGPTWHTVSDDLAHLDKNTLKAVGQTLVQYLLGRPSL